MAAAGHEDLQRPRGGPDEFAIGDGRTASLRYGRFDAASGQMTPQWQVGSKGAASAATPWTLWHTSMRPVARDALLGQLAALTD